jgi:hypothetical protein
MRMGKEATDRIPDREEGEYRRSTSPRSPRRYKRDSRAGSRERSRSRSRGRSRDYDDRRDRDGAGGRDRGGERYRKPLRGGGVPRGDPLSTALLDAFAT